jgi:DNA-binding MarR family transcriptional regulator
MKARSTHRTARTEARMRIVLEALRSYGSTIFPKQDRLARQCKMTKATLVRMLDELKRDGILTTEMRGPTSCLYFLSIKQEMAKPMAKALAKPLAKPLAKALPPYLFTELKLEKKQEQAGALGFSQAEIEHPAVQAALRRARWRIEAADDPKAYTAKIIREELAAASARPGMVRGEMPRPGLPCQHETPERALAEGNRELKPGEVVAAIPTPPQDRVQNRDRASATVNPAAVIANSKRESRPDVRKPPVYARLNRMAPAAEIFAAMGVNL